MLKSIKTFDDYLFLNDSFKEVKFFEKDHKYKIRGELCNYSVTSLLKNYSTEFESEKIAKNVAFKQKRSINDVLKEWEYKKNYSCFKGTEFHKYVENFLNKKFTSLDDNAFHSFLLNENVIDIDSKKISYKNTMKGMILNFFKFYEWYQNEFHFLKSEFVVGDFESKVCGTIDNLSINKDTRKLSILDYKTNQNIKTKGFKGQKLLNEMSHLDDCELTKYSLQLHIYKHIIEKNTQFEVDGLYIVWFPEDKQYELIKPLSLQEEAKFILKKQNLFV